MVRLNRLPICIRQDQICLPSPKRHRLSPPGWTYLDGIWCCICPTYSPPSSSPLTAGLHRNSSTCLSFTFLFSEPRKDNLVGGWREILSAIKWKSELGCCWTEGKWVLTSSDLTFFYFTPPGPFRPYYNSQIQTVKTYCIHQNVEFRRRPLFLEEK